MKENNEVMQGDNTARGPSASGADLSVGAVLNAKTKENKIQEVKRAIAKVAEKKEYVEEYKVGDEYILNTEVYKVVEVLGNGDYHLKNTAPPYNSFLTTDDERF